MERVEDSFAIKEDGTIIRTSKIEDFKKKISGSYEVNDRNDELEDVDDDEDELHKFFPVAVIALGETTVEEVERHKSLYDKIEYEDDDVVIAWINGIKFFKENDFDCFTGVYMTHYQPMFQEWKEMGFSWDLSYRDWKKLFLDMGYGIYVQQEPRMEYWDERGYWYLSAKFTVWSPDYSIHFDLDFSFGEYGYSEFSNRTLYSIKAYSNG